MRRRTFLAGTLSTAFGLDHALAQGNCKVEGPTSDEIFADLLKNGTGSPKFKVFEITIKRSDIAKFKGKRSDGTDVEEEGVIGELFLNGSRMGETLENEKLKIPLGEYPGYMRYVSHKNFVQGPFGDMANVGDFLIEIGKVKDDRNNILLHGGTKPWHSKGCILLGAVKSEKDSSGKIVRRWVDETNALRVLRKSFYGSEMPSACPNTAIRIKII